jgi:hypothetical protein
VLVQSVRQIAGATFNALSSRFSHIIFTAARRAQIRDSLIKGTHWSLTMFRIPLPARTSGALLSLAFLLGACSPGRIDYQHTESPYDAFEDHWAPYTRPLYADVTGNPFPIPQDDFNKIVNAAIQGKGIEPSPTGYRVRMIFNGAPTNGNYICSATGETGSAPGHSRGSTVTLSAAYCRGSDTMTFLQGSVGDISGPDDPRLKEFLRFATVQLFPLPEADPGNANCTMPNC